MGFLNTIRGRIKSGNRGHIEAAIVPVCVSDEENPPVEKKRQDGATIQKVYTGPAHTRENKALITPAAPSGVARIEAVQQVWGRHGKYFLWAGLAMMMLIFELDNSTVYNYQNYAASSFNKLSFVAALGTATTIVSAVVKPPIAKISDVVGRGETYILTVSCYVVSYVLCAKASSFNMYAAGTIFYAVGQAGTQILDQIIISDISTMRWRGFAYAFSYTPFLITPWISAFIVQSVVDGIGWRWGIGMFAILMPFSASFIITTLLYYQGKAKKIGVVQTKKITVYEFCSLIDLGGVCLLSGGIAMLLLPLTIAATTPSRWSTPWVGALMAIGGATLICLIPYEKYWAKHPVLPVHYFQNLSITLALALAFFDAISFSATHTYMYPWAQIAHNYNARDATFLVYTNGVTQCLIGIVAGAIMYRTREYKWLMLSGVVVRTIGYGIMIRLRGFHNSTAELFAVQCIQGWGSGIVATLAVVVAQIHVPHAQLAQMSSLALLFSFVGSAIGSAVAGSIYTSTFKDALRHRLGADATDALVDTIFNSITSTSIPSWGSPDRVAAAMAYSDVMRYISYMALGISFVLFPLAWFLPRKRLGDAHNLVQDDDDPREVAAESK